MGGISQEAWWVIYNPILSKFFLPTRFKYDKRKAHLSALILSGDISRDQALKEIAQDLEPLGIEADIDYLCVKLQISRKQFDDLMNLPKNTHENYITLKNTLLFRLGKKLSLWSALIITCVGLWGS